ncbi:uncharacterized protein LOC117537079 [Gymnodraco acuticeps]|uniref:Uncharacterized protein LOC117537079 n=1 Tax=Gymnodraco acuticeps TaxID=8218 RepID=A0A6P8T3I4_GYMAC|nr:uncharacterized protein LOC117537079 [Gymnodraco acuticeps]
MEHPVFRRAPNGTLLLKATAEASTLAPRRAAGQALYRAKKPEEVDAEAWAHVSSEGGSTANATLVLSRWKVQFGQYQGKIFHWLLENDVGYAINLVASHQKERERTGSQSPLMANKDAFTRYSSAYPDFLEAVRFHRAFEEARACPSCLVRRDRPLLASGTLNLRPWTACTSLWTPKKSDLSTTSGGRFPHPARRWRTPSATKSRDRQRPAAVAAAASTTTSTVSVSGTESEDCIKVHVVLSHRPLGSALAAFVSGRRSLSAVELQAKIKKLVVPKPAFPASLRSALPSKPSEEPSDDELIRAVVDMEESSDVQAPLPLHPPPATPSSAPQKGAGVSAVLGEPTDEELLEATQEQDHALRPPAVVQPALAPSSLPQPRLPPELLPDRRSCRGQPSSLLCHVR